MPRQANFALKPQRPHGIDTLSWQECEAATPRPDEVRVRVSAAGLNFRDVMAATGLLPKDAEKDDAGEALGLEFAGVIESIGAGVEGLAPGDRVFGMARGSLRRDLTLAADRVYRVPDNLSDEQAAAIPSVYLTAHYALHHLARLRAGERVLIHSGAGGVGVAAIALAKRLGAEIYATAGSAEKRDYLKSLGVRAVMDSRSLAFADEVLAATGGEGVDLVLNALPGPFIEKGLACLAPSGRFIELGKRDIYDDRALGLKALRRNISLHVVDLAALIDERPALIRDLMDELIALFAVGRDRAAAAHRVPGRPRHRCLPLFRARHSTSARSWSTCAIPTPRYAPRPLASRSMATAAISSPAACPVSASPSRAICWRPAPAAWCWPRAPASRAAMWPMKSRG